MGNSENYASFASENYDNFYRLRRDDMSIVQFSIKLIPSR